MVIVNIFSKTAPLLELFQFQLLYRFAHSEALRTVLWVSKR
jgi:hypothetical protein